MRIFLMSILFLLGCEYPEQKNEDFVKTFVCKWGNENFIEYINYSAGVRSLERNGQDVCIIVSDMKDTICRVGFAVIINIKNHTISETWKMWLDNERCLIDTTLAKQMALKLNELNIASLRVQDDSVVYVHTTGVTGKPNLVRFPTSYDMQNITKDWKLVSNRWYERIDEK